MNLSSAPGKASRAAGPKSAARLHNDIEYELAMGEHPPEHERSGEEALRTLQRRFPGVQEQAREIDRPPSVSRTAKRNLDQHGSRSRSGYRKPTGPRPAPAPRPGNPRPNRSVGQRVLDADLPSLPSSSASQLVVQFFAWGMGLSLLYLILTNAKAPAGLFGGLANVTRTAVAVNIDPLNPHFNTTTALARQRAAATAPRLTQAQAMAIQLHKVGG